VQEKEEKEEEEETLSVRCKEGNQRSGNEDSKESTVEESECVDASRKGRVSRRQKENKWGSLTRPPGCVTRYWRIA